MVFVFVLPQFDSSKLSYFVNLLKDRSRVVTSQCPFFTVLIPRNLEGRRFGQKILLVKGKNKNKWACIQKDWVADHNKTVPFNCLFQEFRQCTISKVSENYNEIWANVFPVRFLKVSEHLVWIQFSTKDKRCLEKQILRNMWLLMRCISCHKIPNI